MGEVFEEKAVRQWVSGHMDEAVADLARICRIRSFAEVHDAAVKPYGQGCIDVLQDFLKLGEEYGFQTRNYDNYVGCVSYGDTSEEYQKDSIGIWAHLDVVHEGDVSQWQYPPYEPTVRDGYMIARGCQDNKSSAIIGLYTLRYLKDHHFAPRHGIQLYLGTCEEQGMYDLDYYTAHYPTPRLNLVPDSRFPVCCGERGIINGNLISGKTLSDDVIALSAGNDIYKVPDTGKLTIVSTPQAKKAAALLGPDFTWEEEGDTIHITAHGITCNAAGPSQGVNAIALLTRAILTTDLLDEQDRELFRLADDINAVPDGSALGARFTDELSGPTVLAVTTAGLRDHHLVIGFAARYPYTLEESFAENSIRKGAAKQNFSLEVLYTRPAIQYDPDRTSVRLLTALSNRILGEDRKPYVMSGGTYARRLPNAFAYGAGMDVTPPPKGMLREGHGDYHQADESVALERVEKGTIIYILAMQQLDGLDNLLD